MIIQFGWLCSDCWDGGVTSIRKNGDKIIVERFNCPLKMIVIKGSFDYRIGTNFRKKICDEV